MLSATGSKEVAMPTLRRTSALITAIAGLAGGPALAQPSFTALGDLPGGQVYSDAWGVSADGSTVVGSSIISGALPFGPTYGAFRWKAATGIENIYSLGGIGTTCRAFAATADGTMVVGMADYGVLTPTQAVAFVWREGFGATEIGDLPGGAVHSSARGVSANGVIIAGSGESDLGAEPFRYTAATMAFLGLGSLPGGAFGASGYGISADGLTIVGSSMTHDGTQAFRWNEAEGMVAIGHLGVPKGITPFSEAYAASADGSVIVGLSRSPASSSNGWEAFRWTQAGGIVGLGDFPGGAILSAAYATSADGSIVVGSGGVQGTCNPFGCPTVGRAFIWDAQHGMRDLAAVLTGLGLNLTGWTLSEARGISADGRVIVGTGTNPQGNTEAWRADLGPAPCYANCDGSTGAPVLNVNDFVCFQSRFAAADPYADCNHDQALNVNDFICFQGQFAAGCP
jgi:probable HAF family extracellular repeat protein